MKHILINMNKYMNFLLRKLYEAWHGFGIKLNERNKSIIMKGQAIIIVAMFFTGVEFSFSQTQILETINENKPSKTTQILYCGMVYFDDSTKVETPKKQMEKTPVTRKQTKKSLPVKSEKAATLRKQD